jgi:hypothetical protein
MDLGGQEKASTLAQSWSISPTTGKLPVVSTPLVINGLICAQAGKSTHSASRQKIKIFAPRDWRY